jgi:7-cyano-7-deazaguanine synthase in queuosine biosynthesis
LGEQAGEVRVHLERLTRRLCAGLPAAATDLLEVAAYVYAADQMVPRGGLRQFDYGPRWRRHFRFEIPVRRPKLWQRPALMEALIGTLTFLTDDDYEFAFRPFRQPPRIDGYLFDEAGFEGPPDFDEVLLFSGGLDSLCGAVREILAGQHKVVLVSHRSNSKIASRQSDLVEAITKELPNPRLRPLHLPVAVNKDPEMTADYNQRSRSFLFAALGAIVARVFKLHRLRFYENGVSSFNLPLSPQVIGGRASRTTHPQVLKGYERLFSELFGVSFQVENPFLWRTKAQILREIKASGYGGLCGETCSCIHTHEATADKPHCGCCSQCVDRRLTALAAGLNAQEDRPDRYRSDVLTGAREGEELTLVEEYHRAALRLRALANPTAFLDAYPELVRALGHVGLPSHEAAERAWNLHRSHGEEVSQALSEEVRRAADPIVLHTHPPNSLLGVACGNTRLGRGEAAEAPSEAALSPPPSRLALDEERFEARLAGGAPVFLGNTKEFWLLVLLNRRPGVYVPLSTLREQVWRGSNPATYTIQRTVSNLRRRLESAGLSTNLIRIDGSQRERYRLVLAS